MATVGYARVSTKDQNLDMQVDALKEHGCKVIFKESVSAFAKVRPEFERMREYVHDGDVLVVWKLDRVGRSMKQIVDFMEELKEEGVGFVSLHDQIDTTTPMGKLVFHITAAFAEMEHDIIVERTKAGLEVARARGRVGGRARVPQERIDLAIEMYRSGKYTVKQVCERAGIGTGTLYRYLADVERTQEQGTVKKDTVRRGR